MNIMIQVLRTESVKKEKKKSLPQNQKQSLLQKGNLVPDLTNK